jgi:hypothetical protein
MRVLISLSLIVFFFIGVSCGHSNNITLSLKNETDHYLDSGVLYMNDYKVLVRNIRPNSSIDTNIVRDSITHNTHDVTIRVSLFTKNKISFKGGFYYSDLGGYFNNRHKITIKRNMNVIVE